MNEVLVDTDVVSYLLNRHSLADVYEELLVGYAPMISFMTPYNFRICLSYAQITNAAEKLARLSHF